MDGVNRLAIGFVVAVVAFARGTAAEPAPIELLPRTLVVALEVGRDEASLLGYTVKPRPYRSLPEPEPPRTGGPTQVEAALLGPGGVRHAVRVDVPGLCLAHGALAEPHVEGDTIEVHRESLLVELPELAGFDRLEVAIHDLEGTRVTRRLLATEVLDPARFQPAGSPLRYEDLAFAAPAGEGSTTPATTGQVLWPEDFGDPNVYRLQGNAGEVDRRINVVIVPDGYAYGDKALMDANADALVAYFRNKTPYKEHDPFLNYILVYAYSLASGTDQCDCGIIVDTAMATRFPTGNTSCGNDANRCLYYGSGCDTSGTANIAAAELRAPAQDVTVVMVNTTRYGGCGGARAVYSANNASATEIAVHELGHSLALLADEYAGTSQCGSFAGEINTSLDAIDGAWPEWLPQLGAPRQGAQYYDSCVFRPRDNCDMRALNQPFCEVCNQQWALRFFGHTRVAPTAPIASMSPQAQTSAIAGIPASFSVGTRLAQGAPVTNAITWRLSGPGYPTPTVVGSAVPAFNHTFQEEGAYQLSCEVIADTNFIKPPRYGPNVDTAVWTVEVTSLASANDACSGAEVIPASGPFPHLTAATDITYATSTGDPAPSCSGSVSRGTWYQFVPAASGSYTISSCADSPTATTVDDTVIAIFTGAGGTCAGFTPLSGGCDDHSCLSESAQAVVTTDLTTGTTYFIVAYKRGTSPPTLGNAALQLRVSLNVAPANDECGGAEVIPGAGPFPHLTALTPDVTYATSTGDPPAPVCTTAVSRSLWYRFAPAVSGSYTVSSCADGPTGTTVDDTVIDIVTGAGGACSGFAPLADACDDQGCLTEGAQAIVTTSLTAGTTYFIVVYKRGASAPAPGNTAIQLRVSSQAPPANELCGSATPLSLNIPLAGSTELGIDDYRAPNTTACFSGIGQSITDARGRDVAYTFTAPAPGGYAFRVHDYAGGDAVLYLSPACPTGPSPQTVTCLAGANRTQNEGVEEVSCVSLAQGQSVYAFVDDRSTGFDGTSFVIEVETCTHEVEPNDTPETATPLACGIRASMGEERLDFFSVPLAGAGWRLFAIADGAALDSTSDLDARATTATDTLEYDDQDNDIPYGLRSPNLGGTPLPATQTCLRIDDMREGEPYRIYAVTQPPIAFAAAESEPNDAIAQANALAGDYYLGALAGPSPSTDEDVFAVEASAGDLILVGLDGDPQRDETPINAALEFLDETGAPLVAVDDNNQSSDDMASPGTLLATRPRFPAEAIAHRVATAGTYHVRVSVSPNATIPSGSGDYLLSIAKNCLSSAWADLSIAIGDDPDPVAGGSEITYTIAATNAGPGGATDVEIAEAIPAGTTFQSVSAPAGWGCTTPVQGGTGDVVCSAASLNAEETAPITLVVRADACAANGAIVTSTATVSAATADIDLADVAASTGTTISSAPDTDGDGANDTCDADDDDDGRLDGSDCAPLDATAFEIPDEVTGLIFVDKVALAWNSAVSGAGSGTLHDVPRGTIGQWPVGSGASESCLSPGGTAANSAIDLSTPAPGTGRWYLVRGRNVCGAGTYGSASSGASRATAACP